MKSARENSRGQINGSRRQYLRLQFANTFVSSLGVAHPSQVSQSLAQPDRHISGTILHRARVGRDSEQITQVWGTWASFDP